MMPDQRFPQHLYRTLSPQVRQDMLDLMRALVHLEQHPHDMIAAANVKVICRRYGMAATLFLQKQK